jgi:hypothetical protein
VAASHRASPDNSGAESFYGALILHCESGALRRNKRRDRALHAPTSSIWMTPITLDQIKPR